MCERVNVMYGGHDHGGRARPTSCSRGPAIRTRSGCSRASRASTRRGRAKLHPIEGAAAGHAQPRRRACPFQPRCRLRGRAVAPGGAAAARDRAGHWVACFNPVPAERVGEQRAKAARRRRCSADNGNLVEVEHLKVWFPIKSRDRARPPCRRRARGRRRQLRDPPRRDARPRRRVGLRQVHGRADAAPPLQADRRARIVFDGQDITTLGEARAARRCAGGCRSSSRTRSRR